jgi:phosphoglycolate phosphatase-like HAD superfamily hydrolase
MKIRTERANALGLTYREFTAVLLDRGRNATTLFFGFAGVLARRLRPEALMPGVAEKLSAIRPGASFVIENGPAALVESVRALAARCRHAFTRILVDDQRSDMRLPAPGMARHLLAEHARMPGEAVMIGDSVVHEQAAKAAGLGLFIWAWRYLGPKP